MDKFFIFIYIGNCVNVMIFSLLVDLSVGKVGIVVFVVVVVEVYMEENFRYVLFIL